MINMPVYLLITSKGAIISLNLLYSKINMDIFETIKENEKEYTLTAEQEERLLDEIKQSQEDIKNGKVHTQEEVENYFAKKIASRKI
jgi:predicted transcriptional regulator